MTHENLTMVTCRCKMTPLYLYIHVLLKIQISNAHNQFVTCLGCFSSCDIALQFWKMERILLMCWTCSKLTFSFLVRLRLQISYIKMSFVNECSYTHFKHSKIISNYFFLKSQIFLFTIHLYTHFCKYLLVIVLEECPDNTSYISM